MGHVFDNLAGNYQVELPDFGWIQVEQIPREAANALGVGEVGDGVCQIVARRSLAVARQPMVARLADSAASPAATSRTVLGASAEASSSVIMARMRP